MGKKAQVAGSVVAGFPSPAEQYLEPPLDLNELLVKRPAATFFVRVEGDSIGGVGTGPRKIFVILSTESERSRTGCSLCQPDESINDLAYSRIVRLWRFLNKRMR